jgi:hypothetical protein
MLAVQIIVAWDDSSSWQQWLWWWWTGSWLTWEWTRVGSALAGAGSCNIFSSPIKPKFKHPIVNCKLLTVSSHVHLRRCSCIRIQVKLCRRPLVIKCFVLTTQKNWFQLQHMWWCALQGEGPGLMQLHNLVHAVYMHTAQCTIEPSTCTLYCSKLNIPVIIPYYNNFVILYSLTQFLEANAQHTSCTPCIAA